MHHYGHFDPAALASHPTFDGHSEGYRQAPLVDETAGSVHNGLTIAELASGGVLAPHIHSYEESFYVLSGEAIVRVNDQAYRVGAGDLGVLKVGTVHGWRTAGSAPVRWLQMAAPQPKPPGHERDTFFVRNGSTPGDAARLDPSRVDGNLLGHFDVGQIPPGDDGSGLFVKYVRRGSGYYIDVGASQLIADGKIKLKSGIGIQRLKEHSVVMTDGSELPADLIVYATGY